MSHKYREILRKWLQTYMPLKAILTVRLIFGFYFKIHPSSTVSFLLKTYCVTVGVTVPFVLVFRSWYLGSLVMDTLICFVINILMSLFTEERGFVEYCTAIADVGGTGWERPRIETEALYILFLSKIAYMTCALTIHRDIGSWDLPLFIAFGFVYSALQIEYVTTTFVFDVMYQKLKLLRLSLEKIYIAGLDAVDSDTLWKYMISYKKIIDCMRHQENELQVKLALAVIRIIFNSIVTVTTKYYGTEVRIMDTCELIFDIAPFIIFLSMPAIFAELTANEVDYIEYLLIKFEGISSDIGVRAAAARGALYLRLRRPRARLLRAVPLDSSLLISLCDISFTYTVVFLQMFHII